MGDHPPSKQNRTQSLHFESNEGISAPPNPLSPAAAEEAACIAEDLLTDEWIGVGAHRDRSGLAAWSPTDHIARRCIPVTPRVPYEDCCRYFCRASAGEVASMPRPGQKQSIQARLMLR